MRRPRAATQQLPRMLSRLYKPGDRCDVRLLREIQKCPDTSKATALLSDALAHSIQWARRGERLCRCKLGSSARLIAPPHSFRLPNLEGVRTRFQFSTGTQPLLPLARSLVQNRLLREKHIEEATSLVDAIQAALTDVVSQQFCEKPDQFSIELGIVDSLDDYRKPDKKVLFFVWNNTADPQYIPLRPIYERLEGNPQRERLMASLYHWLYRTASSVFEPFGFVEAEHTYQWRREAYLSEREAGEDVDLEGEVEYADPAKVVAYIRDSRKLRIKAAEIRAALTRSAA
jgi:hypothetical protein